MILATIHANSGENELQYPDDALWSNPGDLYHLTPNLLPSPRVKNTMTYVEPFVVTMGGYSTDGSFLDDIHIYDTRSRKWSGVILKRRCCDSDGNGFESMGATEVNMSFPIHTTNLVVTCQLPVLSMLLQRMGAWCTYLGGV